MFLHFFNIIHKNDLYQFFKLNNCQFSINTYKFMKKYILKKMFFYAKLKSFPYFFIFLDK